MKSALRLVPQYILWHYSRALVDLTTNWKNFLWFLYHFFSIPLLVKTLFAPWERMDEAYRKGFDPESFFSTLVVNTVMRVVGAFMRSAIIIFGLISLVIGLVGGVFIIVLWLLIPLIVIGLLILGGINLI